MFRNTKRILLKYTRYYSPLKPNILKNDQSLPSLASGATIILVGILSIYKYVRDERKTVTDITHLSKDLLEVLEKEIQSNPSNSIVPTLVRLAWHASGTYSAADGTGGSNGATMRFPPESDWKANAGLKIARDFLEPFKTKYPDVSYADLWTLAGVLSIKAMNGPKIEWRRGRVDANDPSLSSETSSQSQSQLQLQSSSIPRISTITEDRLPAADSGCVAADVAHLRNIFGRMGFNDREIVALAGAHAIGRCHTEASGYWGPWTNAETTFSNEYFRLLLEEKWTPKKTHNGKKWEGPNQYENPDGSLMMLPTDIALINDPIFKDYVELYAKDEKQFFNDFSAAFSKLLENGLAKKIVTPSQKLIESIFGDTSEGSTCVCTTVPCPVVGKNYLTFGGGGSATYNYEAHGSYIVVVSATATISNADLNKGTDTTSCTQQYSRNLDDDGVQDCDAGHILANRLGGWGNHTINIFPQDLSINRGAYAQYENSIYDCISSGASSAKLNWTFTYASSTRTKPEKVAYTASFTGGSCTSLSQTFTN